MTEITPAYHDDPAPRALVAAGEESTQGFGEQSLVRAAETSSVALAEQAKAMINARYIMAMQRPRDLLAARQSLLADCKRPRFAEVAIYHKPIGAGVEGPSIRLAEAAARSMRNIATDTPTIYDDSQKRIVRVCATDLEANVTYSLDVTITKTVERNKPMPGRKVVMVRKNSKGQDTFVLEAIDDEIVDKERALISKAMRTCLLRLIPGDILEEAIELCYATRRGEIARDPKAALKKMVDAYESIGVSAAQVAEYLGHPIDATTSEEIDAMRSLFLAIRDKETTWSDAFDARRQPASTETVKTTIKPLDQRLADKSKKAEEPKS